MRRWAIVAGIVTMALGTCCRATQSVGPEAQRRLNSRLVLASIKGQIAEMRQAIADGADVNGGWRDSDEPLRAAVKSGQVEAMRVLVVAGARVESPAGSLLPDAIRQKDPEVTRVLIELGADVNRSSEEAKPLEVAVAEGKAELAKLLLAKGAAVPVYEKRPASRPSRVAAYQPFQGTHLLNLAAGSGDYETFAVARRVFPDVRAADAEGLTALHMVGVQLSAGKDRVKIAQELLAAGLDPHAIARVRRGGFLEKGDWTPLRAAVAWSSSEVALALLRAVKHPQEELTQSLYAASKYCSADVVEEMLRQGAKVEAGGKRYDSALNAAVWGRDIRKVRLLLDHGASIDLVLETQKRTALLNAVAYSTAEIVEELLKRGADPGWTDASGNNAKALAALRVSKGREVDGGKQYYPEFAESPDEGKRIAGMLGAAMGKR